MLEHKPLWLGILNEAFHDSSPSPADGDGQEHVAREGECVDIKEGNEAIVHVTSDENRKEGITKLVATMTEVVENSSENAREDVCVGKLNVEERIDIAEKEPGVCQDGSPKEVSRCRIQHEKTTDEGIRNGKESTSNDQRQHESSVCREEGRTSAMGLQQQRTGSNEDLKEILEPYDNGAMKGSGILVSNEEGDLWSNEVDTKEWLFEDIIARVSGVLNYDGGQGDGAVDDRGEGVGELGSTKPTEDTRMNEDLVATSGDPGESVSEKLRTNVNVEAEGSEVSTSHSGGVFLECPVDSGALGNGTDRCEETSGRRDTPVDGMSSCDTGHERDCGAVSESDVKVLPEIVEDGVMGGGHERKSQGKVSFSAETKANTLVETHCAECGGKKTTQDSDAERISESKMPHGEDFQGTTAGRSTLEKKVSNSVFYERTSERARNSDVVSKEPQLSEQFLDFSSLQNDDIALVRLSSSSSADTIGCFCGGKLAKTSSPYRPDREIAKTNLK